ncbi:GNAT family N-acetyltransferase [Terribacillus saccharophilus]|uniref:N-acetyltransferase domain-containing protein n=1 Tax=Terribacillus saccharophilus TaxID=361277 RepID=A0ABX4H3U1_9BACI|nr:GNAT family N-acetyltransferase [Terribacillus saccharophilus]PAD34157.1 hypothetical protein CHH56_15895 [Terribacillus saccharophilus]PAD98041.1 hypothetical protein CHH50_00255 [Terribacillus saccharophilus]PAE01817.1 hypothetical protein CHH48_00255 [Terribacillus saccharophilus]
MNLRELKFSDAKEVARLTIQLGYLVEIDVISQRLIFLLQSSNHKVFVSEESENNLSGWVHIYGKHLIELQYAEIGGLVVDKHYRKRGIGAHLMKKCEEWARLKGYQEIRLRSGSQRVDAHNFYRGIGYENVNSQELFVKSTTY